jgi:hypothetical protein
VVSALSCLKVCLCALLFARFPNVLPQNKTANCEKWQEKPLPIRGHGRQRSIDIQDSLESRVIRSSANADFELPAPIVGNLNQGRVKQAVRPARDLQWNVAQISHCRARTSGWEPGCGRTHLGWLQRGEGSDNLGIENRAVLFLNQRTKVYLTSSAPRWIGEHSHNKGWSSGMELYCSSVGQRGSEAGE